MHVEAVALWLLVVGGRPDVCGAWCSGWSGLTGPGVLGVLAVALVVSPGKRNPAGGLPGLADGVEAVEVDRGRDEVEFAGHSVEATAGEST